MNSILLKSGQTGWQSLSKREKQLHLAGWFSGLLLLNWPRFDLLVGPFRSTDYSLLFPSLYGALLNGLLVYGVLQLVQRNTFTQIRQALGYILVLYIQISLIEGLMDSLYYVLYYRTFSPALFGEITFGTLLMNGFFFLLPALTWAILRAWPRQAEDHIRIRVIDGHQLHFLAPNDLLYLSSDGNYVRYHTPMANILSRRTLTEVGQELPNSFIRCHRSYIINATLVDSYTSRKLYIASEEVPIGRSYKERVKDYFEGGTSSW